MGREYFRAAVTSAWSRRWPEKVREAAGASLARLFPEFNDADDHRWPQVIQRARNGAEHPLEGLAYNGKTEEHPVCSTVLSLVGSGKKGKEVRSYFSGPPYGWPRDAIDAALIGLFETGHLRATANGVALKPRQLDQAKVPNTDFRIEGATIDTPKRLKLRKLFQNAGIDCKPNEELVAAGRFLTALVDLAERAGGEAPLPECPDTGHLSDLQALAGNEQLVGILEKYDELESNFEEWGKASATANERMPAYKQLLALTGHAESLDAAKDAKPQIEAIIRNRSLLAAVDPVPDVARKLADALRVALAQEETHHNETYDSEYQRLKNSESWRKIKQKDRDDILSRFRIKEITKGATGTEQEVLESLERISLEGWRTRTAALPKLFADARAEADRLIEPKIRHVKLTSPTLRTQGDVKAWIEKTEQDLLHQINQSPIVIG